MQPLNEIIYKNRQRVPHLSAPAPWHPEIPARVGLPDLALVPFVTQGLRPGWVPTGVLLPMDARAVNHIQTQTVSKDGIHGYARVQNGYLAEYRLLDDVGNVVDVAA